MTTARTELEELAQHHVDFYRGKGSAGLGARWVETVWAPDVEIRVNSLGPRTRDEWIASHTPASASQASEPQASKTSIDRVMVADDGFVLQGSVAGFADVPIALCMVFAVVDGVVVRMDEYLGVTVSTPA
jgi:hypothetical protein